MDCLVKNEQQVSEFWDLWLGLNVLTEKPLLVEGVAGFPCEDVYGALVDLLLDCTKKQEKRLAHRFLENKTQVSKSFFESNPLSAFLFILTFR